ncbi:MAG: fatty acid desaturase [Pseudomonadota bacterium]
MTDKTMGTRGLIGMGLAILITCTWLSLHIYFVHVFRIQLWSVPLIPLVMAAQCWLSVGLFIISHDAIHGSLAPGRPRINRITGWIVTTLYAGFDFDRLKRNHDLHHVAPGTADDPDFSADHPTAFIPWFKEFFLRHFGFRPLIFVNSVVSIYWLILGVPMVNILLFYGIPSILSAVQLFYFGTFRPHRHDSGGFVDEHRARSSGFGWLVSLFSCYHFGYHHEHHLFPSEPWWRLPKKREETEPMVPEGAAL